MTLTLKLFTKSVGPTFIKPVNNIMKRNNNIWTEQRIVS